MYVFCDVVIAIEYYYGISLLSRYLLYMIYVLKYTQKNKGYLLKLFCLYYFLENNL